MLRQPESAYCAITCSCLRISCVWFMSAEMPKWNFHWIAQERRHRRTHQTVWRDPLVPSIVKSRFFQFVVIVIAVCWNLLSNVAAAEISSNAGLGSSRSCIWPLICRSSLLWYYLILPTHRLRLQDLCTDLEIERYQKCPRASQSKPADCETYLAFNMLYSRKRKFFQQLISELCPSSPTLQSGDVKSQTERKSKWSTLTILLFHMLHDQSLLALRGQTWDTAIPVWYIVSVTVEHIRICAAITCKWQQLLTWEPKMR